jgi:hypothetical protein
MSACETEQADKKIIVPEPESQGAGIFKKFCSACHAPPRISSHKANEWFNIVDRMQTHRIKKAYNPLSESEKSILVAYLQKHSKK